MYSEAQMRIDDKSDNSELTQGTSCHIAKHASSAHERGIGCVCVFRCILRHCIVTPLSVCVSLSLSLSLLHSSSGLRTLNEFAKKIRARRIERGALMLASTEVRMQTRAAGIMGCARVCVCVCVCVCVSCSYSSDP